MVRGTKAGGRHAGDREPAECELDPIAVGDLELTEALVPIPSSDPEGTRYGRARLVVRVHTKPLGVIDVPVGDDGISAASCAAAIWAELGDTLNEHLRRDRLPEVTGIDVQGVRATASPLCLQRRAKAIREAPRVSVIICTRNRATLLARTLRSLERLHYPD